MSLVIKTLIYSWAVPYMNARRWVTNTFSDNIASQRVFIKNGFKYKETVLDALDLSIKGCGIKSLTLFEFNVSDEEVCQSNFTTRNYMFISYRLKHVTDSSLIPTTPNVKPRKVVGPLMLDPVLGEPYIQLSHPHKNIRITPPRKSDAAAMVSVLNDDRVHPFLKGPPFPYAETDATSFIDLKKALSDTVMEEISEAQPFFSNCPVRAIREILPNGVDIYIGDIDLHRSVYIEVLNKADREELAIKNKEKSVGDSSIVWCPGGEHDTIFALLR